MPKHLPRTRLEYDLSADEKAALVEKIGEEVSETLDYTPAKLIVIEHARAKYVCRKDGESTIRTAFAQPSPLPKTNASAGLLAQILTATFADHLPLHRQERIFQRHGAEELLSNVVYGGVIRRRSPDEHFAALQHHF